MRRWGWVFAGLLLVACGGSATVPSATPLPTATITPAPSSSAATPANATAVTAVVTVILTPTPLAAPTTAAPATVATLTAVPPVAAPATDPPPTNTPVPPPVLTATPVAEQFQLSASVSNSAPRDNTSVTVTATLLRNGAGVAGATMTTAWHYKTTTSACSGGPSGNDGVMRCARQISRATVGYTVRIDVRVTYQGTVYTASTSFTPV